MSTSKFRHCYGPISLLTWLNAPWTPLRCILNMRCIQRKPAGSPKTSKTKTYDIFFIFLTRTGNTHFNRPWQVFDLLHAELVSPSACLFCFPGAWWEYPLLRFPTEDFFFLNTYLYIERDFSFTCRAVFISHFAIIMYSTQSAIWPKSLRSMYYITCRLAS